METNPPRAFMRLSLEPQLFQKVDQSKRKLQIKDLATSLFTANWIKEEKRQLTTFQSETV